jgi:F0F1-type ATP synthase assembly protein I
MNEREREQRRREIFDRHVRAKDPERIDGKAPWFRYASASSLGIEMVVAIAIGALSGRWLENHVTHWSPWTTLLGLAFGIAAAVKAILRTIRHYERELAAYERAEAGEPTPATDANHRVGAVRPRDGE